ncbi:MAG: UDP-N-acetylmuramate--L-alanine ligase [Lachnospiraceae bacterium]|nr:UDP-N-acetylmuramate--L-alanine ligase [Lachnospiraceae bacterium]
MYELDLNKPVKVFFCGIGGISMSGLAEILLSKRFKVAGSDIRDSELTERLEKLGAEIHIGQEASNVSDDTDLFVYTAAISPDNPEFSKAVEKNIPMLTRAELLGEIMHGYGTAVCVSGTHGKTTTTSMVTEIFIKAGMDPTVTVGGMLKDIGGNLRIGSSGNFIAEACEYTNSFHSFFPTIALILNIEEDHMDFFKDINDIRASFKKFASLLPADGTLVINSGIEAYTELTEGLECRVVTFGTDEGADYRATDISFDDRGLCSYTLHRKTPDGEETEKIKLSVPGEHNVYNSLAAIAAADAAGADKSAIVPGLESFKGAGRRFEYKGEIGGVTVIDDYAHHPSEIKATLLAAERYPHKRLWVVFQPHTYTRTKAFLDDFAKALSMADEVVLLDIYAAREKNTVGISSADLKDKLDKKGRKAVYFKYFDDAEAYLLQHCTAGDLVLTVGAGDVYRIGEHLLGK